MIFRQLFFIVFFSSFALSAVFAQAEFRMGSVDTLFTCRGFFTDTGGANARYGSNENLTTTICADTSIMGAGSHIKLLFRDVNIFRDHPLCFFDGTDTNAPLIACAEDFSGNPSSNFVSIDATFPFAVQASAENITGCITVSFNSGTNNSSGWVAEISCIPACQKIVGKISAATPEIMPADTGWIDACPGQQITLNALSDASVFPQEGLFYNHRDSAEYIWDMGDGTLRYGTAINHTYQQSGGYIVQLKIQDQLGCTNSNVINQRVRISTKPSFTSTLGVINSGCSGDTITLNAAVNATSDSSIVSVLPSEGTFLAQRIRSDSLPLPDGTGAAYTTAVTFSNFASGQTLQDASEILGICLNIEHSWLRDLEISLACPNGQSVILHDHPGRQGANRTNLGEPELGDTPIIPGIGYDYCWVNNAPNPTWIEFVNNDPNIKTLPSGDYSSFDPLSDFIGCPLNGEWSITVKDLWAQDNGFIFSWGIEFDPNLFPDLETFTPEIVSYGWEDDPTIIQRTDESITAVPDKSGEAGYIFAITDDFGCVWDTSIAINVLPPTNIDCYECQDFRNELRDTMLCAGEQVELVAGPRFTETIVGFETSPRYDQLGFPNHPLETPYQSAIEVTDIYPGIITDPAIDIISVCVDIETGDTDWVADLTLSLRSPDGAFILLSKNNGGAGSNYTNTCFTPTATVPIQSGDAPFTGEFMPEESWNNLIGQPMNGTWILEVTDDSGPQLGIFNSWSLTFNSRNGINYTWSPANGLSCNDCPNPSAQPDNPQVYQVSMEDVFGCTYNSQVEVGSVADFSMPLINCGVSDPSKRQITFDWTAADGDDVDYEVRVDGSAWSQPNNGALSHMVDGLRVSQTVTLEVRPFIPNAPDDCDIPIAQSQCTYNVCTFNIGAPDAPTPVSCVGLADGTLAYNLSEGTAPYSFSLNGNELASSSDTMGVLDNLPAGMLDIIITDADNCADTLSIEVAAPDSIMIDATVVDALCRDGNDGSIELILSGGTGTLSPDWSTGATTPSVDNLTAGSYDVSILDENNCRIDTSFTVGQPDSILIDFNVTPISCAGESDGAITLSASGGTGLLTYNWSNGADTPAIDNLDAGTYRISVSDDNGCLRILAIEVESPALLVINEIIPINVDCNGSNSGSAIVKVSGGTMPYEYLWSDDLGQLTDTAKLLVAGNYEVSVTDAGGCEATEIVTITEPEALSLEFFATAVTCFDGMDGTSTAIVEGGVSPYNYLWNDTDNQMTQIADSLAVGTYSLIVTDANNCTIEEEVEIGQPMNPITASFEQTFTSCFGENDGALEVTAEGGSGINYTYLWSNGQAGTEATNLATETYTVTITDQNMCNQVFESPKVEEYPEFDIIINFQLPTCNGFEDATACATVKEGGPGIDYLFQ
ncbi:MAG: proprotein convertase P-domain-containing protein, partial [Bacteroidota bacterium]